MRSSDTNRIDIKLNLLCIKKLIGSFPYAFPYRDQFPLCQSVFPALKLEICFVGSMFAHADIS